MNVFKFFHAFFSNDDEAWKKIPNKIKVEHSYMLYRMLANKYPKDIHELHISYVSNDYRVIDALHNTFKRLKKQPQWAYNKKLEDTKKRDNEAFKFVNSLDKKLLYSFCEYQDIEFQCIDLMLRSTKEDQELLIHELKDFIEMNSIIK